MSNSHKVFFDKDKNEDMEECVDPGTICVKNAELKIDILYLFVYAEIIIGSLYLYMHKEIVEGFVRNE